MSKKTVIQSKSGQDEKNEKALITHSSGVLDGISRKKSFGGKSNYGDTHGICLIRSRENTM